MINPGLSVLPGSNENNSLPLKTIQGHLWLCQRNFTCLCQQYFSSNKSTRTCSHPHKTAQGGKTSHFAPSPPDHSLGTMPGWFCKHNQAPSQWGETREQLHGCLPVRMQKGEREGMYVFNMFAHFESLFLTHVSSFMQNISSVFCLLEADFILKCSIFMARRDKDMRRAGKVVQKAIKSGGWLL